jgi:uncharacterized membrane protein YgcG
VHRIRRAVATAVVAAGLALAVAPAPARAQAGERILSYGVDLRIEPAGTLLVSERIAYDFGDAERHGIFRDLQVRLRYDDRYDRVYPVHVVAVSGSPGTPDQYELENEGSTLRIRIGDPDKTISGRHDYTVVYRVEGALNGTAERDELYWNAIGTSWEVPIERATARVSAPATISQVACYAGPQGSTQPCGSSTMDGATASFSASDGLAPLEGLTVVVGFPAGAVPTPRPVLDERWTMARAFSATPRTLTAVGGVMLLVLAGLGLLFGVAGRDRRAGRDAMGHAAMEPTPPEGIRPGQAALLVNAAVQPLDITATVVDLAVRGYLRIEEVPPKRHWAAPDWRLAKLKGPDEQLTGYERKLLTGLFESGHVVELSQLKQRFRERYVRVRAALYQDAVARRWFTRRPDKARWRWIAVGAGVTVLGLAALVLLAAMTHFGLAAIPLVLAGPALMIGARSMCGRTPAGAELRRRVLAFRQYLTTAGSGGSGDARAPGQFSPYLPYAMVFGLTERWTRAFALVGAPPNIGWYEGSEPYSPDRFQSRLDDFAHRSGGTFTSMPPSSRSSGGSSSGGWSSGGGGSAGGGGGGGGGGSW